MMDSTLPVNAYTIGESVYYFCGVCQNWVSCKILSIQEYPEKITISHSQEKIGLYKDDLFRLRKVAI